ncbi:DinB family protein [Chloroflexota bacterium]
METYDKQALLEKVRTGRAAFDALLGQFPTDGLLTAYPPDGWSVKDMMAHIAFWEDYALGRFQDAAAGKSPQADELSNEDLDRINQAILDADPARTLAAVQEDYECVHQELWAALQALPDTADDPWWDLWPQRDLPLNLMGYNTYDHYEEHALDLRRWLAG